MAYPNGIFVEAGLHSFIHACMEIFTEHIVCVRPCVGYRGWRCKRGVVRVLEGSQEFQRCPQSFRSLSILLRRASPALGALAWADHSTQRGTASCHLSTGWGCLHGPGCCLRCQVFQGPPGEGGQGLPQSSGPRCQPARCEGGRLARHWCRGVCCPVSRGVFICTLRLLWS